VLWTIAIFIASPSAADSGNALRRVAPAGKGYQPNCGGFVRSNGAGNLVWNSGCPAHAVVNKTRISHVRRLIKVAAVDYDRIFQELAHTAEVQFGKFFPLGQN